MFVNEDNFSFEIGDWHVVMANGELKINDIWYEQHDEDPTYDLVIWIAIKMFEKEPT